MKTTKPQLKKILLEELNNPDSALLAAIGTLSQKMITTGQEPLMCPQGALGRFARVVKPKNQHPLNDPARMNELVEAIVQELRNV